MEYLLLLDKKKLWNKQSICSLFIWNNCFEYLPLLKGLKIDELSVHKSKHIAKIYKI